MNAIGKATRLGESQRLSASFDGKVSPYVIDSLSPAERERTQVTPIAASSRTYRENGDETGLNRQAGSK